jgi:hypothetical protein
MDDAAGVGLHDRAGRRDGIGAAAAHHGERSVLRADLRPGHWRIDTVNLLVTRLDRDLAGDAGGDGGMVDEGPALAQSGKYALRAEHDIGQIVVIADACQHDIGIFCGIGGASGDSAGQSRVGLLPFFHPRVRAVEDGQAMPCLADMPGNRPAHHAKADEGYCGGFVHGNCL